jgi:hypothetical protein
MRIERQLSIVYISIAVITLTAKNRLAAQRPSSPFRLLDAAPQSGRSLAGEEQRLAAGSDRCPSPEKKQFAVWRRVATARLRALDNWGAYFS